MYEGINSSEVHGTYIPAHGIVAVIFAIIGIASMVMFGSQFGAIAAMPGAESIGMILLLMWVVLIVELLIGIFSMIAGSRRCY